MRFCAPALNPMPLIVFAPRLDPTRRQQKAIRPASSDDGRAKNREDLGNDKTVHGRCGIDDRVGSRLRRHERSRLSKEPVLRRTFQGREKPAVVERTLWLPEARA